MAAAVPPSHPQQQQHTAPSSPPQHHQQQQHPAEYCASLSSVRAAARRIAPHVRRTPVLRSPRLDALTPTEARLYFKAEALQVSGSFKYRGACNAVFSLSARDAARGVTTHSSGNHAAALAAAAAARGGTPARIVVPEGAPAVKVAAVRAAGAELTFCAPTMEGREAACARIVRETGSTLVPPYNSGVVVAGQGTMALELFEQVAEMQQQEEAHATPTTIGPSRPHHKQPSAANPAPLDAGKVLDAIVVPISGGGMTSGIAIATKALHPSTLIVAAEPVGANGVADVHACKAANELLTNLDKTQTIADGLQARLGDQTWPVVRDLVDEVVTVTEQEIRQAMRAVYEQLKVAVEPSGAVGLAAVMARGWGSCPRLAGCRRVGVILCGGNVDVARLPEFMEGTRTTY